jgi:hypothetical protein
MTETMERSIGKMTTTVIAGIAIPTSAMNIFE